MSPQAKSKTPATIKLLATFLFIIMIPFMMTNILSSQRDVDIDLTYSSGIKITVSEGGIQKSIDLEDYVIGVVASQIMADTPIEAIKVQAVIARTNTIKKLGSKKTIEGSKIGQVYLNETEMKQKWGMDNFYEYYTRLKGAVINTEGIILVHNKKTIDAIYHGVNTGKTRNAKNVEKKEIPYLVEIDSPYDKEAPDYMKKTTFSKEEFIEKLKALHSKFKCSEEELMGKIGEPKIDSSDYIINIKIAGVTFTGEELRKVLGVASASIEFTESGDNIVVTTKGQGQGIGLSQYGAFAKAKDGEGYEDILKYYYQGAQLKNILE